MFDYSTYIDCGWIMQIFNVPYSHQFNPIDRFNLIEYFFEK
jgi:hypothetical protein